MTQMNFDPRAWLAVAFLVSCVSASRALGEPGRLPDPDGRRLLQTIIDQTRDNYARIKTWQGSLAYTENSYYFAERGLKMRELLGIRSKVPDSGPDLVKSQELSASFAVDCAADKLYMRFSGPSPRFTDGTGRPVTFARSIAGPLDGAAIVTPKEFMHADPIAFGGPAGSVHRATIEPRAEADRLGSWSELVDPRKFFTFDGRYYHWETIKRLLDQPQGEDGAKTVEFSVEETQSTPTKIYKLVVKARLEPNAGPMVTEELVFEEGVGFNATLVRQLEDGVEVLRQEIAYATHGGIWLPEVVARASYERGGAPTFRRTVTMREATLNVPIAEEKFTLKALGLKDGERVVDKIRKSEFDYAGCSGRPTSQPGSP